MSALKIAVALMRNGKGELLLVRKRGTIAFMQPGGKIEPDEDARSALSRELQEELDVRVSPDDLTYLGMAEAPAANEPGVVIRAEIYDVRFNRRIEARAEIAEAVWVEPSRAAGMVLAPLTRDYIVPLALTLA